ncbi:hypothetical protein ACJMK2_006117 [Sinanodonta woodiana]|uniref:Uncharacterized protein n=1 Tax=Sinanodonta woodiana TaxID=1069815 RepID=A0ABD3VV96_SINWO
MRHILYCMVIVVSVWPVLTAVRFDDPCEVFTVGVQNETTDLFANRSCGNGSVYWAYPRGSIRVHFISMDSEIFSICFSDWLIGSVLTFFDASTGKEHNMPHLGEKGHSEICTMPHQKEVVVRLQAPETLVYVAAVLYQTKRECS